ncbi:S8/S53 family peptidase [Bdellovibrionota bacterium FG-1]
MLQTNETLKLGDWVWALGFASVSTLAACSSQTPSTTSVSDAAHDAVLMDHTIQNLRSGLLIRQIEGQIEKDIFKDPLDVTQAIGPSSASSAVTSIKADVATDPCGFVSVVAAGASEAVWTAALIEFGKCVRAQMKSADLAFDAFIYYKTFAMTSAQAALSELSDGDLEVFLNSHFMPLERLIQVRLGQAPSPFNVRQSYRDFELDEVVRLAHRRYHALKEAEARVFLAVDAHRSVLEHFASKNSRWQLLLRLRDTSEDLTGEETGARVVEVLLAAGLQVPNNLKNLPLSMLHPLALIAVSPDQGRETVPLGVRENPFDILQQTLAEMGGGVGLVSQQRKFYQQWLDKDNPEAPVHAPPSVDAVRVAVLDTGLDFVRYPELGLFLGNGQNGSIASYDYGDDDLNPYLPARGMDGHGSGTTATILTTLAHFAPDVLKDRKLDLAVWKTNSIRNYLAAPWEAFSNWQSPLSFQDALISQALAPATAVRPKIVSISAIFPLQPFLVSSHHEDAVLRAPWLWVMAAGNGAVAVEQSSVSACLSDVPPAKRVDSRILCVGALKQGILDDRIAAYSNYGERVDVYAYESYIDLCPSGTSCATPAISGAAAALAARYPEASPEQIKEVVVAASEERELEVDSPTSGGSIRRKVRVFDPGTMMTRLFDVAAQKF